MKVIFDVIINTRNLLFEKAFKIYINVNQDVVQFKKIDWLDRQFTYSGNVIIGEVKAYKWKKIIDLLDRLQMGIKVNSIRRYLIKRKDIELQYAERERERDYFSYF